MKISCAQNYGQPIRESLYCSIGCRVPFADVIRWWVLRGFSSFFHTTIENYQHENPCKKSEKQQSKSVNQTELLLQQFFSAEAFNWEHIHKELVRAFSNHTVLGEKMHTIETYFFRPKWFSWVCARFRDIREIKICYLHCIAKSCYKPFSGYIMRNMPKIGIWGVFQ